MIKKGRETLALIVATGLLSACGGSDGGGGDTVTPPIASYLGTTGVFAAWANTDTGVVSAASTNSFAGKKQSLRGNLDFMSGASLPVQAGVEVYKGSDGHIYGLDLAGTSPPAAQQLSSESGATIDDACTLSGSAAAGGTYDYVGVYFTADLVNPTNSSYIYRLPGPDGTCGTADDVVHIVKTGMAPTDSPITASGMPLATVRTSQGGISGFVVKSGANLLLVDGNFANPVTLGTFSAPINVAVALPVGTTQGYPTGQLYVVDGNIVYVDYAGQKTSAPLFSIPGWTPTNASATFASSPDTLFFSINTKASGATPAATTVYAMPADGSAAPAIEMTEPGRIASLLFPIQGGSLLIGYVDGTNVYSIQILSAAGVAPTTLMTSTQNAGTFIATASTVYYETWSGTTDTTNLTVVHANTQSGIVAMDGTVIQTPLADSTFVNGGEQEPWPNDTTTTITPYITVFQVRNLTPVTVTDPTTGYTYTEDGVSGGTLSAIDTGSNQTITDVGMLPTSTATTLSGTFRGGAHTGFIEATNPVSTENPSTRDLYLFDSQSINSLARVTNNL